MTGLPARNASSRRVLALSIAGNEIADTSLMDGKILCRGMYLYMRDEDLFMGVQRKGGSLLNETDETHVNKRH